MAHIVTTHYRYRPPPATEAKVVAITQAVVVIPDKKWARLLRAERWAVEPREPNPEVEAFFARIMRPPEWQMTADQQ